VATASRTNEAGALVPVRFELLSSIRAVEVIASRRGVRVRRYLNRRFGRGNWHKMKGFATVLTEFGETFDAEIHWYEAHGIGKRDFKIKKSVR
jgi:hypothetical protein